MLQLRGLLIGGGKKVMKRKIGLYDIDSKIPNLALMKLSAWHKQRGDQTELYFPLKEYDKVYASQIFKWSTPVYHYDKLGGSGTEKWGVVLPKRIEHIMPDYSLYPNCNYAMGFTTRGCIRRCPFCIVNKKEGLIQEWAEVSEFWNGQKEVMLLDNNILAASNWKKVFDFIIKKKITLIEHGMDIRLINEENADYLSKIKFKKKIHFAFDNIGIEKQVRQGIKILEKARIKPYRSTFYVIIGFDSTPEEDLYRVELLRELGSDAFVMPFDKNNRYQKDFARWVNHKAIFRSVKWENYKK